MEDVCKKAEAEFIKNPSIMNQIKWVGAVRQYKNQLIIKNKRKRLQLKQENFEQVYYANKIVNYLIKQHISTLAITEVRDEKGEMVNTVDDIGKTFYRYYEKMYTSTLTGTGQEIENLEFLKLTEDQKGELEKDIEVEEVKEAIKSMGKGKSPGPNGIPLEMYQQYVEIIAPILTKMYRGHLIWGRCLPPCTRQQ